MKIRGRKLKTSLSCTLSLLLALSSFGFALAETQTQRYNVPLSAELVPEGYLDFTITAGPITATNSRENPNTLTYSSVVISNNESTDAIEVSSIAYTAPSTEEGAEGGSFTLAANTDSDFATTNEKKFSMVVACGANTWDLASCTNTSIQPSTLIYASSGNNTATFSFSGKVSSVDEDMAHINFGMLTVTVAAETQVAAAVKLTGENLEVYLPNSLFNKIKQAGGQLQYSTDGNIWSDYGSELEWQDTNYRYKRMRPSSGNTLYIRGKNISTFFDSSNDDTVFHIIGSDVHISGNIEALRDWETVADGNLPAAVDYAFDYLFKNNSTIVDASALVLPQTDLSGADSYYLGMFSGCTALTAAPELLATSLGANCCFAMFQDCTSLETPPALRATVIKKACYASMFDGCTSLNAIPALPATKVAMNCYSGMFEGCTGIAISENKEDATYINSLRIPQNGSPRPATSEAFITFPYDLENWECNEYANSCMAKEALRNIFHNTGSLGSISENYDAVNFETTYYTPNEIIY